MDKTWAKPKLTFGDTLRFTVYAYGKLRYMRDKGPTEVAGYCVTATEDPLLITDFVTIKQECDAANFEFDADDGVDFMERMMDKGLSPWAYSNVLAHTHPSGCNKPSQKDKATFAKAFSHPNWAIMLILAKDNKTYCRLKVNVGPGVVKELKVAIDWNIPCPNFEFDKWDKEYKANVTNRFPTELLDIDLDCYWDDDQAVYEDFDSGISYGYEPVEQKWFSDYETGYWKEIPTPKESWVDKVVKWTNARLKEIAKEKV